MKRFLIYPAVFLFLIAPALAVAEVDEKAPTVTPVQTASVQPIINNAGDPVYITKALYLADMKAQYATKEAELKKIVSQGRLLQKKVEEAERAANVKLGEVHQLRDMIDAIDPPAPDAPPKK